MKRKKFYFSDIINNNIFYHNFDRIKNAAGVKGWRYVLSEPLSDEKKQYILSFKNVVISECAHKYAPELKYNTLIVFDKCI